jgi:hypothetical protein
MKTYDPTGAIEIPTGDAERGGVAFGPKMRRRLALGEYDLPFELRQPTGIDAVRLRVQQALTLIEKMAMDEPAEPTTHPDWQETTTARYGYGVVPHEHLGRLAQAWMLVENVERDLPSVECWCVVKETRYRDEPPRWTTWTGHVDREQAEAFAPVIAAHYARKNAHGGADPEPEADGYFGGWRDRFHVRWAVARVRDVVGPLCSPEEYVRRLGT